jgi:RNA polymerase sigma-70 factor (ECF subfamily)
MEATTTTALLEGLHDPSNSLIWVQFDGRYRPIILGFARRLGLSEDDSADIAQETLVRFVKEYRAGKYDRTRGRLRSWIVGLVRYRVADLRRDRAGRREVRGESAMADIPAEQDLDAIWEAERRAEILRQALQQLRTSTKTGEKTIHAFDQYVLQQRPAQDVADELGMTLRDVYMAKNRIAARLRDIIAELEPLYDDE